MNRNVRTVYATVPERFYLRVEESRMQLHEPASLVGIGHRLAILVNQGSDPTVPYQALVTRESAMLFLGFTPWGR
jgi:hypothetical protein